MFKVRSFRVIFAMAALSLAACNSTSSDNAGVEFHYDDPETFTVKCNQSGTMILDVQASTAFAYSGGVEGTTLDGDKFAVQGAACIISQNKVKPNVAKN